MQYHHAPDRYLTAIRAALPLYDELQDQVVRAATGVAVGRMLDLGVGTGETSGRCLEVHPGATVLGLDASEDMLALARLVLGARIDLRLGRLQDSLPEGPFDVVVSALAVHHLDGSGKADLFRRIGERLAPGGRLVIADVVLPDSEPGPATPIDPAVDKPDLLDDQLTWLRESGFAARVRWKRNDLAVIAADLPSSTALG